MRIIPQQKLHNTYFYNNICIIIILFCILCFWTAMVTSKAVIKEQTYSNIRENSLIGPINITNKSQIYRLITEFRGNNSSSYISGEVLDENKDTLYEFGKDLWHEDGYDSEGYWSESDRQMIADLTFSEKGTYYIQFNTDENNMQNISLTVQLKPCSYIPHLQVGSIFLLLITIFWWFNNRKWLRESLAKINESMEEASDD